MQSDDGCINSSAARGAMRNVQVALVNDPTRLQELNVYVTQGRHMLKEAVLKYFLSILYTFY